MDWNHRTKRDKATRWVQTIVDGEPMPGVLLRGALTSSSFWRRYFEVLPVRRRRARLRLIDERFPGVLTPLYVRVHQKRVVEQYDALYVCCTISIKCGDGPATDFVRRIEQSPIPLQESASLGGVDASRRTMWIQKSARTDIVQHSTKGSNR